MRTVLRVTGEGRVDFLQGLVTNDVTRAPVWAAMLTPQGKYLADFLVIPEADALLIDVDARLADDLLRRLSMYRLRADVQIAPTGMTVVRGVDDPPPGAIPDPRHPALGWRLYTAPGDTPADSDADWDAIRVAHAIPETLVELIPNETYPLEAGFERLHGVDFRKGCYVGQEVTARMKHKTELRKGLVTVSLAGAAVPGTAIVTEDGREAGTIHTVAGDRALAHLRFDRIGPGLTAGGVAVTADL